MSKGPDAFRTISEVAEALDLPQHVLRFWETRFVQIRPLKRGGGRRYYRPDDVDLLRGIRQLLYGEGFTIKGVQRILREQGPRFVINAGKGEADGKGSAARRPSPASHRAIENEDEFSSRDAGIARVESAEEYDEAEFEPPWGELERSPRQPELSGEEVRVLKAALAELLECRRLLDEAG